MKKKTDKEKKPLSEKQLAALAKGREKMKANAKQMQAMSVEKRLENKRGRESALAVLSLPANSAELLNARAEWGVKEKLSQEQLADLAMLREAKKGNTQAYDKLMKKAGLMEDQLNLKQDGVPTFIIGYEKNE